MRPRKMRREREKAIRERLKSEDIRWGVDTAVAQIGALGGPVALLARFSDLVVLKKPYGPGEGPCRRSHSRSCAL